MSIDNIHPTPWDTKAFGLNCFEITELSEQTLAHASANPGHYTIKVDPLADKELLHRFGFYYTDTLIEPVCFSETLINHYNPDCTITNNVELDLLLPMCDNSFLHGRFHRDFNLPDAFADQRYKQWLSQIYVEHEVFGLYFQKQLAGFIAHNNGNLLLHTVSSEFRGKALAKFFWSAVCRHLFQQGIKEIRSSISATNLPVLNLYVSLGFRFRNSDDIYHRKTEVTKQPC